MATLTAQQLAALKTWTPEALRSFWAAARKANPSLPATPPGGFTPNVGGFAPFTPPERPPPGTYDPALDAQQAAAGRGLQDTQQDYDVGKTRAQDDFTIGKGELDRSLQQQLQDLLTGRTRSHADYLRAKGYTAADYGTDTQARVRNYGILGESQVGGATAAGVSAGGALQQALQKRLANQGLEQGAADTAFQRWNQNADQSDQRQQEDYDLQAGVNGRLQQGHDAAVGQLSTGLDRAFGTQGDQTIALARAGRENTQLGTDIAAQRWYQSTQAGYDPPQRPASQHVDAQGKTYKVVRTPRGTRRLYSTGYLTARP